MKRFLPLMVVGLLMALFLVMLLRDRNPQEIKSVMIGRPAPEFSLPGLMQDGTVTSADILKTGKPVLVNFFASWCVPCRAEHANLMKLAQDHGLTVIGIAYKDQPATARAFLNELGNPFAVTALDLDGRTGLDWGVSGVPETFIVDGDGIIRYRHWGPVVAPGMDEKLLPAVKDAE